MDKDDVLGILWIFFIYGYLFAVRAFVPDPYATYLGFSGIIILIAGMWLQELYFTKVLSEYRLIKGILFPSNKVVNLFYRSLRSFTLPNGRKLTVLELGKPAKFPELGKVDRVYIHHDGEFSRRFRFTQGTVRYAGMSIKHPACDHAVLYEYAEPLVDHGRPYPQVELVLAGGDYPSIPSASRFATVAVTNGGGMSCQELREAYERALAEAREYHMKLIRLEEETEALRTEIKALLKSRPDVNKLAKEMVMSFAEHYGSILSAARNLGRKYTISLKGLVPLIVAGAAFAYLYAHPEVVNQIVAYIYTPQGAAVTIVVILIILYLIYRVLKKVRL